MNSQFLGNNSFDSNEGFKGGRGGSSNSGAATGAVLAGGAAGAMSSSGSGNMERCPLDDTSFYCQLSKTTNIVAMVVYLVMIFIIIATFGYYMYQFFSSSGNSRSKSGRK